MSLRFALISVFSTFYAFASTADSDSLIFINYDADAEEQALLECVRISELDFRKLLDDPFEFPPGQLQGELSWKAILENHCDFGLQLTVSPFAGDILDPEILDGRQLPIIPPNSVKLIRSKTMGEIERLSAKDHFSIGVRRIRKTFTNLEYCSSQPIVPPPIVFPIAETSYAEILWGAQVQNSCDETYKTGVEIHFLDKDGFLLWSFNDRDVYVPANGIGYAGSEYANIALRTDQIVDVTASLTPASSTLGPEQYYSVTRWHASARTLLDQQSGEMTVDAEIAQIGLFKFTMQQLTTGTEALFQIDRESFRKLPNRPPGYGIYSSDTQSLSIPSIISSAASTAENVRFDLVDPEMLIFRLADFNNHQDEVTFAHRIDSCVFLNNFDATLRGEPVNGIQGIDWTMEIESSCEDDQEVEARYHLLNQEGVPLSKIFSQFHSILIERGRTIRIGGTVSYNVDAVGEQIAKERFEISSRRYFRLFSTPVF